MSPRWLGAITICAAALATAPGCKPEAPPAPSYSSSEETDAAFQSGANRPPTAKTLYAMARLLGEQGRRQEAALTYTRCIRQFPDFVPAYEELAQLYVQADQVGPAIAVLKAGHRAAPRDPDLINNLGMCFLLQRQYSQAMECFRQAAAGRPDDARFRANLALALGMLGRYDEALALNLQALPPAQAHYNMGVIARARHDAPYADEQFRLAVLADPAIKARIPRPDKPAATGKQ